MTESIEFRFKVVALEYKAEKDLTESVDHDSSEFN